VNDLDRPRRRDADLTRARRPQIVGCIRELFLDAAFDEVCGAPAGRERNSRSSLLFAQLCF